MTSDINEISIQFIGENSPDGLTEMTRTTLELIDQETLTDSRRLSVEDRGVMAALREDIADTQFESVVHRERPRFAITPQELEWRARHGRDNWLDYLIHRYKFQIYPAQQTLTDFPLHLLIEPTAVCNLRCTMCFQVDKSFSSDRRFVGMMSWELFTSLADQAADSGCQAITLASRGEPTIHKRFGDMLMYLSDKGILDTKINTNATFLTEKMSHAILSANVSTVSFSVDASNAETYERIRVKGKFDKVLANIQQFNEIRHVHYPNSGTTTRISGVAVEDTQDPVEMKEFWSNYVDHVVIVEMIPRWSSYDRPLTGREPTCSFLYERLYVWFDGICNPCDFDYKSLLTTGDATKESIAEVWAGEKFQRLRSLHNARKRFSVVPCDRCVF